MEDINIFACLDYIRDHAKKYAKAKAERIYLEEYRKSLKAQLMSVHIGDPVNAQEREAYAHPDYAKHLEAMKFAIEEEEKYRWLLIAAQAKVEVWRSLEANKRAEAKIV